MARAAAVNANAAKSQTIDRAALLLTCFSTAEPRLSLAELARRLGLNQSTVYRYAATLQAAGLLERDAQRGGYRLGLRVVELANVVLDQLAVRREGLPEMDCLRDESGLLVNLALLDDGDIVHIAHSAPQGWPPRAITPGRRAVANCTALGKVLLAHEPWEEVRATIERRGWRPYTPDSIRDFDVLEAELGRIRDAGHAVDDEERARGNVCLGVPIRDHTTRVVAAMSVTGTTRTMAPPHREEILVRLLATANRISLRLGHPGSVTY